jgi:hypothetical protein
VTLLLSQEFELPDVLRLWDALFADDKRFLHLHYVCVAMVTLIRDRLLAGDFGDCLQALQHYRDYSAHVSGSATDDEEHADIYVVLQRAADLRAQHEQTLPVTAPAATAISVAVARNTDNTVYEASAVAHTSSGNDGGGGGGALNKNKNSTSHLPTGLSVNSVAASSAVRQRDEERRRAAAAAATTTTTTLNGSGGGSGAATPWALTTDAREKKQMEKRRGGRSPSAAASSSSVSRSWMKAKPSSSGGGASKNGGKFSIGASVKGFFDKLKS